MAIYKQSYADKMIAHIVSGCGVVQLSDNSTSVVVGDQTFRVNPKIRRAAASVMRRAK